MAPGMMCLPKSVSVLSSSLQEHVAVEDVNAHGRQEQFVVALDAQACGYHSCGSCSESCTAGSFGFSTKRVMRRSASICMMPSDGSLAPAHGNRRDGDVRAGFDVLGDDVAEIHAIQLIAAQDQQVIEIVIEEMNQVFAHGVGGALIPGGVGKGLFGREDFDEAAGEMIELVGLRNVPMQRRGVELRQQVNAAAGRN